MRSLHSELVKFFTTRLWLWLGLTVTLVSGTLTFLVMVTVDEPGESFGGDFTAVDLAEFVTFTSPIAYVIAAVIGIIGLTGEYRHQMVTPTLLAVPQRWKVLVSKVVLYGLAGAAYGFLFVLVQVLVALPLLDGKGYDISLSDQAVADSLRGVVVVSMLFGMLGVSIGGLLRNQALAITLTTIYLFVGDNILMVIEGVADIYPYLPGGAARSVVYEDIDLNIEGAELLATGQSIVVLLAWVLGVAMIGWLVTLSRDVT